MCVCGQLLSRKAEHQLNQTFTLNLALVSEPLTNLHERDMKLDLFLWVMKKAVEVIASSHIQESYVHLSSGSVN